MVPHASREESKTLHAFEYLVSRVIIEYVTYWWNLVNIVHWWNLVNIVNYMKTCT